MAIVEALSRALATDKTRFSLDSLSGPRVAVASGAIAAPSASSSKTFSLSASKNALDKAVAGARSVLDTLNSLRGALDAAIGSTGRTGLQNEIQRLTGQIDDIVAESGDDDINLISDPSTIYQMRSSGLGGSISVISQPLGSDSLGVAKLDVSTTDGLSAAKDAVDSAIRTAVERYRVLSEASADLPAPASVTDSLVTSLRSLVSDGLLTGATGSDARAAGSGQGTIGRGALVNFRA